MNARPANTNGPVIALQPIGDGRVLYRALARVLVRRELIFASAIPDDTDCERRHAAG